MKKINEYTFYWLDGTRTVLKGESVAGAFNNAGYGGGAITALDFTCNGVDNSHTWLNGKWVKKDN